MALGGIFVLRDGAWKSINQPKVRVASSWVNAEMVWAKVGASYRNVFARILPTKAAFRPYSGSIYYPRCLNGKIHADFYMNGLGNSSGGDYTAIMSVTIGGTNDQVYYQNPMPTTYRPTTDYAGQTVAISLVAKNAAGYAAQTDASIDVVGHMNTFNWNAGSPAYNPSTGKYDGYLYWGTVAKATGYTITGSSSGSVGAGTNTFQVTGMSPGTNPSWTITPYNSFGTGTPLTFSPTLPAGPPRAPSRVTLSYSGSFNFNIYFEDLNAGVAPHHWEIFLFKRNVGSISTIVYGAGNVVMNTSGTFPDASGTWYARVTAKNADASLASADVYSADLVLAAPAMPTNLNVSAAGTTYDPYITISYQGSTGATGYDLYITNSAQTTIYVYPTNIGNVTSYSWSIAAYGESYRIMIRATNAIGASGWVAWDPYLLYVPAPNVSATQIGYHQTTLSWTAPQKNVSSYGYQVYNPSSQLVASGSLPRATPYITHLYYPPVDGYFQYTWNSNGSTNSSNTYTAIPLRRPQPWGLQLYRYHVGGGLYSILIGWNVSDTWGAQGCSWYVRIYASLTDPNSYNPPPWVHRGDIAWGYNGVIYGNNGTNVTTNTLHVAVFSIDGSGYQGRWAEGYWGGPYGTIYNNSLPDFYGSAASVQWQAGM